MAGLIEGNRHDDGFVVESNHWCQHKPHVQVQIRKLYRDGRSYRYIQQALGLSSKTVAKYLRPITRGQFVDG